MKEYFIQLIGVSKIKRDITTFSSQNTTEKPFEVFGRVYRKYWGR